MGRWLSSRIINVIGPELKDSLILHRHRAKARAPHSGVDQNVKNDRHLQGYTTCFAKEKQRGVAYIYHELWKREIRH